MKQEDKNSDPWKLEKNSGLEELFGPLTITMNTNSEQALTVSNQTLKALEKMQHLKIF